jgi:hypothetical protein
MAESIKNSLGNLHFSLNYLSNYRYYKQIMLENEYNSVEDTIPDLTTEQYENLRMMIEIEMMVNVVQYCSEIAAFAICTKNKKRHKIIQFLSSIAEEDLKNFYSTIGNANLRTIKAYMGYNEISIDKSEEKKYWESCAKFKSTMIDIGKYYNHWYKPYTAYKHGLRLIPFINNADGKKGIMEACKDNTMDIHMIPETWSLQATDMTIAIYNIYNKLYVPLVRYKFFESENILMDESPKRIVKTSDEVREGEGLIPLKLQVSMPWFSGKDKVNKPFY